MGRPNGGDGRWRWRWRCKEPVVFLPCCSFRRCRCGQPNSRSNRGRFSGDPHLPSSKPGTPAGLPGETARTCPGSRLSLQSPVSTPHGWLVVGRACLPTPDDLSRAMPEGARATAGGKEKLGVEKQRRGKRRPEVRLRGLRFDWVGELGWMLSNRSFPDWSRSSRAGFLNLPFRAPSRPPRLVLVFSSSTRYTKTRPLHTTSTSSVPAGH